MTPSAREVGAVLPREVNMAENRFARPENAAEILAAAAILLAARVRGSNHAGIDCERRRAIDDAINLYGELMQRLSALPVPSEKPDPSERMDTTALLLAVRALKQSVDLGRDRLEVLEGTTDVGPKRSTGG